MRPFDEQQPSPLPPSYEPPRRGGALWWVLAGAVVIIAAVLMLPSWLGGDPTLTTTPTPMATTPSALPSSQGTPTIDTNRIPFESGGTSGFWQIDSSRFDSQWLTVQVTIKIEVGSLSYSFFAFDNGASEIIDPDFAVANALSPGTVRQSQTVSGAVRFRTAPGPVTVILATQSGRQITALLVKP